MSIEGPSANPAGIAPPLLRQRYELGERLGQGTFFDTYRGRDMESGRPVAIKVLKAEFASDEAFSSRLLSEASSSTRLTHPNIAQVYDAWREDGTVVLVTEWVRGINLKDRIRRVAPFPLPVAVDILQACAEGLSYAHEAGYVHGDVRPDNIIITPDGRVKITDFGIGPSAAASSRVQLTALHQAVYYLAPEQAEGHPPDARTDIYALGCILYEMLSGHVPFDADSPLAIAVKHLQSPVPSVRALAAAVPLAVDGIAQKCMQKDPMARYITIPGLLQDVARVQDALHNDRPLNWTPLKASVEPVAVPEKPKTRKTETPRRRPPPEPVHDTGPSLTLLGLVALFGVVLIAGFFGIVGYLTRTPGEVTVPDLVGKTQAEATSELVKYHLKAEVQQDFNERVPEGQVYRTIPPKNTTIKAEKSVILWVSKGGQPVKVPDVVGKSVSTAQREIKAAGLALGQSTEEFSEVFDKGKVISQSPTGDSEARKASPVTLILSKGPEPLVEPPPTTPDDSQNTDNGNNTDNNDQAAPPADATPSPNLEPRQHEVSVDVPKGNTGPQQVRIVVHNEDGTEETAYDEPHQPGDNVKQTVTTYGAKGKCQIRVFLNGKLVKRVDV